MSIYDYRDDEDPTNLDVTTDFGPELFTFHDYIVDRKLLKDGKEPTLEDLRFFWPGHEASYKAFCENHDYEGEDLSV